MTDEKLIEVAKQAARILIDGKPSRVVPAERLELLEGVILQHAVGQTPETSEALRKVAQDIHRRAAPDLYGDAETAPEIASDPALTEAVVEMREACAAAAKTFRWYESLHAAKGPEHADKAARNRIEAEKLEATLARITVTGETSDG
jgi:dienelactone hydrolase